LLNAVQFREYLEEHGYDTSLMGIEEDSESQAETASMEEKKA